jgi:hypothetical protein
MVDRMPSGLRIIEACATQLGQQPDAGRKGGLGGAAHPLTFGMICASVAT